MTLNTFGLYRQTNILADFASNAEGEKWHSSKGIRHQAEEDCPTLPLAAA